MDIWEGEARNGTVRLHFIVNVPELDPAAGTPLVIIPDVGESAEDYLDLLAMLAPRPCFAVSLRGRGQSGSPMQGYTLDDHVSDVLALLDTLTLPTCCLLGQGRGAVYALGATIQAPDQTSGLIIGDYPPQHPARPVEWVERFLKSLSRGVQVSQKIMPHVAEALQREGEAIDLSPYLGQVTCPTLIMYGGQPDARLKLPDVERYLELLPDARAARFTESGHDLWEPDYGHYLLTIAQFLERLDGG